MAIPAQRLNQEDAVGVVSRQSEADRVAKFHRRGLRSRRQRDLTSQKYLLHIDGEGDAQWLDVFNGERLAIPFDIGGSIRPQENLLRPIVDNAVAYHTAMPYHFTVRPKKDNRASESAVVDQLFANHIARDQRLNAKVAEAMYLAMPAGFCPIHAFWRDDVRAAEYEPVFGGPSPEQMPPGMGQFRPKRGRIDIFAGDPWDTVFHPGSTRENIPGYTFGRTLPADLVRSAFSHIQGIEGLQGSKKLNSASIFQRIARRWQFQGTSIHGSSVVVSGEDNEELIALVYEEVAPGMIADWPQGRLTVVALQGTASTSDEDDGGHGSPLLLHRGPLPGGTLSSVMVYSSSGGRPDDPHGKPFVADLDDLQVQLNNLLALRREYIRRSTRAPLARGENMNMDTAIWEDDAILEAEVVGGNVFDPKFLELPTGHMQALQADIEETRQAIYTLGGYQAASRGEAHAGDPAAKIIALAKADDTIHGPTNTRLRESVEDVMGVCWSLAKNFMDVPWILDVTGDEYGYIADHYIDRNRLSASKPKFQLVSGFGATPEARAQQLITLVTTVTPTGEPLISLEQFKEKWPDQTLYDSEVTAEDKQRLRPKWINSRIRRLAMQIQSQLPTQLAMMFAPYIHERLMTQFPLMPDDIPELHDEALTELTQDESEDPLVRQLAGMRQAVYRQWIQQRLMAQMQMQALVAGGGGGGQPGTPGGPGGAPNLPTPSTTEGGTPFAESIRAQPGEVQNLTQQAKTGAI